MCRQLSLKARELKAAKFASLPPPQPKQAEFINCQADVAIYGGSAGCGKTFAGLLTLAEPQMIRHSKYRGVVFRNSYPEITAPGGIWDESQDLYRSIGGKPNNSKYTWTFPSGAWVKMSYMSRKTDAYNWKGAQVDLLFFEELTEFKRDGEDIFWYLFSRVRSRGGLATRVRCTTNPDADSWVRGLIDWWIGEDGYPIRERSGAIRWFMRRGEDIEWADTREELIRDPEDEPKSFTFIAGLIHDNQKLLEKDSGYLANLKSQHPVEMERLLKGNWNIRFERGEIYRAHWFEVVDAQECDEAEYIYHCRFWDLAATPAGASKNAFYTVGVKMSVTTGLEFVVQDVIYTQISAGEVPDLMLKTAIADGRIVMVAWEQEPATGGKFFSSEVKKLLHEYSAFPVKPDGSKRARALPYAAKASQELVFLREGKWNTLYAQKLEEFDGTPEPLVADLSDASAGAFDFLNRKLRQRNQHDSLPGTYTTYLF